MCNISILKSGTMMTVDQIDNVVYNNWHSMGLLIRKGKKLEAIHLVPENGELDPKFVYDLLAQNIEHERIIHVRHNTAGATNLENCHPFNVYEDKKSTVWFMHNGTLHLYKSKKPSSTGTSFIDDEDGPSDTLNFANDVVRPYLECDMGSGKGDVTNPRFQRTINKFWSTGNRGILVSSSNPNYFLIDQGSTGCGWKTIKGKDGKEFLSSNDDYFAKVTRGPEAARRLVREEEAKKRHTYPSPAVVGGSGASSQNVVKLSDHLPGRPGFYGLSASPSKIMEQYDFYDRESGVGVGYLNGAELDQFLTEDRSGFLALVEYIFSDYAQLFEENKILEAKHKTASNMVAQLKREAGENNEEATGTEGEEDKEDQQGVLDVAVG